MTKFSQEVYEATKKIPKGKVATYAQIAEALENPRAMRAVGNALHKNPTPKIVPCHRVVNSKGFLAKNFGFGGGINTQKEYLEAENVVVDGDFRVDLGKFGIEKLTM